MYTKFFVFCNHCCHVCPSTLQILHDAPFWVRNDLTSCYLALEIRRGQPFLETPEEQASHNHGKPGKLWFPDFLKHSRFPPVFVEKVKQWDTFLRWFLPWEIPEFQGQILESYSQSLLRCSNVKLGLCSFIFYL